MCIVSRRRTATERAAMASLSGVLDGACCPVYATYLTCQFKWRASTSGKRKRPKDSKKSSPERTSTPEEDKSTPAPDASPAAEMSPASDKSSKRGSCEQQLHLVSCFFFERCKSEMICN